MNARNPKTSDQLGRVLQYLTMRGGIGATTLEISGFSGSLNVATCVSELRHSGYNITCKRDGSYDDGRKVYRYFMA